MWRKDHIMSNINVPHRKDKVKYVNRILAGSEEKALEVLRRIEMPPFIPGLNMVSITDVARFFGVSSSAISAAIKALSIGEKSDHNVVQLITTKAIPNHSSFECMCEATTEKNLNRCSTLRYERDGSCVTAHVPRCSRFTILSAKAILLVSLVCGYYDGNTRNISRVLFDEIMRTYTEDPVAKATLALPAPAEVLTPEVIEPKVKHTELEIPTTLVESISLQVSDDKTILITPETFEFMVRSCAHIIMSR
jgi:hypothetical protein